MASDHQNPQKPANALSITFGVGGKHPGFRKCVHCGVAGYITEKTLIKALLEGVELARFQIVSVAKAGEPEGNTNIMLRPLMKVLRDKGMIIR